MLFDGTQIDEDEYLSSLVNDIELIICTEEQIQKLSNQKPQKHLLSIIFMMLGCFFKMTLMCSFVKAALSSAFYQALFKVFL